MSIASFILCLECWLKLRAKLRRCRVAIKVVCLKSRKNVNHWVEKTDPEVEKKGYRWESLKAGRWEGGKVEQSASDSPRAPCSVELIETSG